jgi:hypothetical protein
MYDGWFIPSGSAAFIFDDVHNLTDGAFSGTTVLWNAW